MTWRALALVFLPTALFLAAWITAAALGDGCRACQWGGK